MPMLAEFIESEPMLDRSDWGEVTRNALENFEEGWGASHELTTMWKNYLD